MAKPGVLSESKVEQMKKLRAEKGLSYAAIGEKFGVTESTAAYHCRGVKKGEKKSKKSKAA